MVGGEMKFGFAFSWADEVEKEEVAARTGVGERRRTNPFGSARPREVVLQEKGIDWRKLDQDLHQPASARYETRIENKPAHSSQAVKRKEGFSSGRSLQPNLENREMVLSRREVAGGFQHSFRLDSEQRKFQYWYQRDFQYKNHYETGREKMFHGVQMKQSYDFKGLGSERHSHHYEAQLWQREYREFDMRGIHYGGVELRTPTMEAMNGVRNLGKSVDYGERRNASTDYKKRKLSNQNNPDKQGTGNHSSIMVKSASRVMENEIGWQRSTGEVKRRLKMKAVDISGSCSYRKSGIKSGKKLN